MSARGDLCGLFRMLLDSERRAASAEARVEQLRREVWGLHLLRDQAGLSPGRAKRLHELTSRAELDGEKGIHSVREWLRLARLASEDFDARAATREE